MTVSFSAPTGRKIVAQGKAQHHPGVAVPNNFQALKGRPKPCAATIRNFRIVQRDCRRASQPVTNRNRLKISPDQRNLIPLP
jgi:hypothetical protein